MLYFDSKSSEMIDGPPPRQHTRKTIQGTPKTLCLPQLCKLGGISSVLVVRQQSPWTKYRPALTCDIAGKVIIATHRSNPSRLQAVREYSKIDAESLIQRFGCLYHANILSSRDCYMDSTSMYAFVDDLPLTLGNLVSSLCIYPTEVELAAIMSQVRHLVSFLADNLTDKVLNGLCYLGSFGLSHRSLSCREILLGMNGEIKIGWFYVLSCECPAEIAHSLLRSLRKVYAN